MVRHCTLTATFVGSTPAPPANKNEECEKLKGVLDVIIGATKDY